MKRSFIMWFLLIFAFIFISNSILNEIKLANIIKKQTDDTLKDFESETELVIRNRTYYELGYDLRFQEYQNEIKRLKVQLNDALKKVEEMKTNLSNNESFQFDFKLNNEIDVFSYSAFTLDKWFPVEQQLYKNNIEKLSGERLSDIRSIVDYGLNLLNKNYTEYVYKLEDFQMGYYRVTPSRGYEYDLFFKKKSDCCSIISINKPVQNIRVEELNLINDKNKAKIINFIIPLWFNKLQVLNTFLNLFESVSIKQDKSYSTLNFVYLYDDLDEAQITLKNKTKKMILKFKEKTKFKSIKFVTVVTKVFSRARALQLGIELCCDDYSDDEIEIISESISNNTSNNDNPLLFFCDIDTLYTQQFLTLCRYNSVSLKRVYYPIMYSFYNPKIVKKLSNITLALSNLTIAKDTGFWRDFGFGMTCQYKKDFMNINGFKDLAQEFSHGWGDEDLFLYRKYIKNSNIKVIRQVAPSLLHFYHEKDCDHNLLNNLQFKHCLESKIFNEASYRHYGFLYFNYTN